MNPNPSSAVIAVEPTSTGQKREGFEQVQRYLARFGYLPKDAYTPGVLDYQTGQGLTQFQAFHGLPSTGEFTADTRDQMLQHRCGLPDPLGSDIGFALTCKWNKATLSFRFDTQTSDTMGEFEAVRKAFMSWSSVVALTFVEVGTQNDIDVDWRPAADPDHSMVGGVLAHADYPPGCGFLNNTLPRPLHFDDSEHVWTVGAAAGRFDVETIALHESGHLIGLMHSSVAGSVMWAYASDNVTKRVLTADDIAGARTLYPAVSVQADWRWCNKCEGMHFGGHNAQSRCPAGGLHVTTGSGNYRIHHNSPAAPGQPGWRWCSKCQGMHFGGHNAQSRCPAGGLHSMVGSGNYTLLQNTAGAVGQHDWRWCSKCQGLWFGGYATNGTCPAGGTHTETGSGNYRLLSL